MRAPVVFLSACLLSLAAQAQSIEKSMPTPILGSSQNEAASQNNGGGLMTDGVSPQQKRRQLDAAIREALARDAIAKQAREQAEAERRAAKSGKKIVPTAAAEAPATIQPAPQLPNANAEDQILQQMN